MTTRETITKLCERIAALVTAGSPVDVVVWRHPGETDAEAIERYMQQHPRLRSRQERAWLSTSSAGKVLPGSDLPKAPGWLAQSNGKTGPRKVVGPLGSECCVSWR